MVPPIPPPAGRPARPLVGAVGLVSAAWAFGCIEGGDASRRTVLIRDSADVRLVENAAPAWEEGDAWRVRAAPAVRIGVLEGDAAYQFGRVTAALRLDGGGIVVADDGSLELRIYDAAGRWVSSAGREGKGPGEFTSLDWLDIVGDSIWAWDRELGRISVWTPDGDFARAFSLGSGGFVGARPLGIMADGTLILEQVEAWWTGDVETGLRTHEATWMRVDPRGAPLDTLGRFFSHQGYVEVIEGGVRAMTVPFARSAVRAVAPDGLWFGDAETWELARYTADGRLARLIRVARPPQPITDAALEGLIVERQARIPEEYRAGIAARYRIMPRLATMPAYDALLVDAQGNLWVRRYPVPGQGTPPWDVLTSEGRLLGAVALPADFTPFEVGADYVLGRREGEAGVHYVELYDLIKPRGETVP